MLATYMLTLKLWKENCKDREALRVKVTQRVEDILNVCFFWLILIPTSHNIYTFLSSFTENCFLICWVICTHQALCLPKSNLVNYLTFKIWHFWLIFYLLKEASIYSSKCNPAYPHIQRILFLLICLIINISSRVLVWRCTKEIISLTTCLQTILCTYISTQLFTFPYIYLLLTTFPFAYLLFCLTTYVPASTFKYIVFSILHIILLLILILNLNVVFMSVRTFWVW